MAYSTNAAIDSYYEGQKAPINAEMQNATAEYEAMLNKLNAQKEREDANAYRSYMRQQRELPGIMRASGAQGGMVDSAVASLLNKYNQGRANRGVQLNADLAAQGLQYGNNMNTLRAKLMALQQQANADKADLAYRNAQAAAAARAKAPTVQKGVTKTTNSTGTVYTTPGGQKYHSRNTNVVPGTASFAGSTGDNTVATPGIPAPKSWENWILNNREL